VLGNALDRGVGVTTYGEHFSALCGLEVVLPSGKVIHPGGYPDGTEGTRYTYKWGVGPVVEGLFSQGNLGVVTQGGIWMMPSPEAHLMFGFTIQDEKNVPALLDVLRKLALDGVIPDKIRVTNDFAVLTLVTQWIREKIEGGASLSQEDMRRLEEKYRFGAWSFCSSVYGRKEHVDTVRKIIVRELSPFGRLLFFDDRKIAFVEKILPPLLKLHQRRGPLVDWLSGRLLKLSLAMVQTLPPLYGIYKGVPTEKIVRRAYFRSKLERPDRNVHVARDRVGLMWFGPLVPMDGKTVMDLVVSYRNKFRQRDFECYVTMLMLNARTIVPLMGIIYRTEDPKETERAVALYRELQEDSLSRGYQQWRCGRLGWDALFRDSPDLLDLNTRIKGVFDPNHTIAPGKYGIH
jgi:4-cresol dehydrogenase (hydroxylating)